MLLTLWNYIMDKQKVEKAVETLKSYNKWRRGLIKESPNASLIGESIDFLTDLITTELLTKN
jgi:hypothetical protein